MKTLLLLSFLTALAGPALAQESAAPARFSESAFATWRDANPERKAQFAAFKSFLAETNVDDVVPAYQLWRTSSSSAQCQSDAFVIPDRDTWANLVTTLRFIRDQVKPAIGPVESVSGYRDDALNTCSGGAKRSAHRTYCALDLVPVTPDIDRATLIKRMCVVHATKGQVYNTGLGFYSARRFHVDSKGFRRWGPDGTGKTSPCN